MFQQSLELGIDELPPPGRKPGAKADCPVLEAIEALASGGGIEARGAIFTRPEVVDFILDLIGYKDGQPLHEKRLLEPSFGEGDFLLPIIERLLRAWQAARPNGSALDDLADAIRAVELHRDTFQSTHSAVIAMLTRYGIATDCCGPIKVDSSIGDFSLRNAFEHHDDTANP